MHKQLALLFLALVAGLTPAQFVFSQAPALALPSWSDSTQKAWWDKNPTPDLWPAAADALQAQLEADYKRDGVHVFSDSDFQAWSEHLAWIRLGLDSPDVLSDPANLATFIVLGHDVSVSHLFIEKLSPRDVKTEALKNLIHLAQANPADLHEYAALGVAYSLVWDQPFPDWWPHRQVDHASVPIGDLDVVQRFHFYVQSNRDKKLDRDIAQLSFDNLKFLVDSQVKLSELEYAQKNRISYSQFSDAFFAIKYDTNRIGNNNWVYNWPNGSYLLSDIETKGGICIDQAYYADTLGKGRGIPTIRFTGFGVDGAHAWFGYLSNSNKWELDCGRYEQQDYPKGFAVDPQTWEPIDDSVLQNFFKHGAKSPNFLPAMTALSWAQLHVKDASYPAILDDAMSIMPELSGTWRLKAEVIEKGADIDKKKKFYQDWMNQFSTYPEMKVEGQKRLYLDLKAAGDPDADGVLKDIILQNRSEGFDLGIAAGADAINEKIKAQDWDGARSAFENTVRDFGEQGGLTLFSKIVYPYIKVCLDNDKIDFASRGITFTEDRMTIDMDSQVGRDFTELKQAVEDKKKASR